MELCEAHQPLVPVARGACRVGSHSFRFSGSRKVLSSVCQINPTCSDSHRFWGLPSRYFCQWIPLQKSFKITYVGTSNCLVGSRIMSKKKGRSVRATCRDVCKVLWSIEADIADGQLLYLTGDPAALGCWEPEKAIPLSPCKEHANLWITETEVPCGIHFGYNYFIKQHKQSYRNIVWRLGPEFSLSIPLLNKTDEGVLVRDLWVCRVEMPPVYSWDTWLETLYPSAPVEYEWRQSLPLGKLETSKSIRTDYSQERPLFDDLSINCHSSEEGKRDVKYLAQDFAERDQPVEEPWLLQAIVASKVESSVTSHLSDHTEVAELEFSKKLCQDTEKVGTEHEHKLVHLAKPVSTVILINSSVCTMQRIAILEDGKLVELLLEPVKNNVQCDSVYVGVVTKLVPHMGGAFVDIGISRPSLMEIKQNREPFVYPPFHKMFNGQELNDCVITEAREQLYVREHVLTSYGEDSINNEFLEAEDQDDSIEFMNESAEGKEQVDELNMSCDLKTTVPNGAVNCDEGEGNFEDDYEENGRHIECGSFDDYLSLEAESSNDTELSDLILENLKDNNDTYAYENKWAHVRKGTKVIVQVVKEGLGTKGPALTAYPCLRSRFWVLSTQCNRIGISKKIIGVERTRLRVIAKTLQPLGFGLTVRTVAASHSLEELQKDLEGLLSTWKGIVEHAKSAALAADEGVEGAVPVLLHRAMGQTLSMVQDYFNEKVNTMVVDSPRTYHEVTSYLQEVAPDLCDRVELYSKNTPIFYEYGIEEEINSILSKRVPLATGGSLVIEQTEALVSIDVNGGHSMLGQGTSQEKAVLHVNLAAAKQIAQELRLRDIGGIIVVDFIDMVDESNKRLVYDEMKKAVERDRSIVKVSELSRHGLMEITRKRVRPSVTFMISEPCTCCHATGRVEALETSFSKIEREICRLLAVSNQKADPENTKSWPRFVLRVDRSMFNYLTTGRRTKLAVLSSSLKVWILLKVARGFTRGTFEVRPFTDDKATDEQQVAISRLGHTQGRSYIPSTKLTLFPVKKWKTRGK